MPLHVSSTCAHHQEVKIALHSLWYHHTYVWHPDDEHMCSEHVDAWNKLNKLFYSKFISCLYMFWAHVLEICRGMKYTYCKIKIVCIKLVNYWDKYTEMHGQQNTKKKLLSILSLEWEFRRCVLCM